MAAEPVDLDYVPEAERVRRLVPTERQLAEGVSGETYVFEGIDPNLIPLKPTRWETFKTYMSSVNPLSIDGPKLPLIIACMIGFLVGWNVEAAPLIAPEIQAEFGLSVSALASIGSFVATLSILMGLPMGYLVDRSSRIRIIRITQAGSAVGSAVQAAAPTFGALTMGRLAGGLALVPEVGTIYPYLADSYPARVRARVFASYAFFSSIGGLAAKPVVGALTKYFGWRASIWGLAGLALIIFVTTLFAKEPIRGAFDRAELGVTGELVNQVEEAPKFGEALRGAWGIKSLRLMTIAQAMLGFTAVINLVTSTVFASKFGLDPLQRSFLGTIGSAITIPALFFGSGVADRLLARRPSALVAAQASAAFLTAFGFVGQAFAGNLIVFVVMMYLPVVLLALLSPSSATVTSLVVPARYRGVGMQIGTPFAIAVQLIGPVLLRTVQGGDDMQKAFLLFVPFAIVSGFLYLASANSVANDMRAAKAAALARQESEQSRRERQNKILVCRDIDVSIDEVQILFRIDLDIREGEVVALVGTNGAGKSTLLRAICGLQQASNGAVFFDGRDVTYLGTHESARMGIVYMPGGQGVFPLMSVRDNLQTAAWMNKDGDPKAGIEKVLDFFPRLRERLDVQAGTMSGGEQQMLALGQAFLMRPRLLMIDELSLGLAPAVVEQLLEAIRGMRDEGITVMLVEQSLNVALTVADRAVFMEKGEIRFDGPTGELLARPDLVRSVFMGGAGGGGSVGPRKRMSYADEHAEHLLESEGLSVAFGGLRVLDDVSLHVKPGEVVGIIGPNGAGKTTLFDALSGYTTPNAGRVLLDEVDITDMSPDARARLGLGRAFQNARLFPPLTVRENIAVALERRANRSPVMGALWMPSVRASERKLASRVDGYIELLGLGAYADKFVRELSTGTRRAVEVACQMAAEPKLLLLDEPSSGLAQAETEALGPALLRIVRETGCGMLVIEHDLPLITSMSDRLIAMELGKVIMTGTPSEVTSDPRVLGSYLAASADVIERSGSRVGSVLAAITNETES